MTPNKHFSIKELEKLIKICKNMGVSSLKYGDLQLSIGVTENSPMTPAPQARGSAKKASQIAELALLQEQYDSARHALETLHVENPSAYEALLMQGALGEEKDH